MEIGWAWLYLAGGGVNCNKNFRNRENLQKHEGVYQQSHLYLQYQ